MPRVYHAGELAVQAQAGSVAQASKLARTVRSNVPDPLSRFLPTLQWILVGAAATDGSVWASPWFGPAGFVHTDGEKAVRVDARPDPGDPLHDVVVVSTLRGAGLLAIDLSRRMRARINGRMHTDGVGVKLDVDECYANCPKYIHRREVVNDVRSSRLVRSESDRIADRQLALVRRADTMFIATVGPDHSADVSHRGGSPGFLECSADGKVIRFRDEPGNGVFNTLGNLHLDARAGLTIIGFETGEVLQLSGHAELVTVPGEFPDCTRAVEFTVERVVHAADAPFRARRLDDAS